MKPDTDAGVDFYRKELAAEFARNQSLEQQIERLLAELSKVKGEIAALGGRPGTPQPQPATPRSKSAPAAAPVNGTAVRQSAAVKPPIEVPVEVALQKPVEVVAASPPAPVAPERVLVDKVSLSRTTDHPAAESPPVKVASGAEPIFSGTRIFAPTSELAHHAWTIHLQPQPASTLCRLRFAAKPEKVERVSIRIRYASEIQKTLRLTIDFEKREMRPAGGKAAITLSSATMEPLEDGWVLFDISFVPQRSEAVTIVSSFVDPDSNSRWDMAGKPGQRILVGAASVSIGTADVAAPAAMAPPSGRTRGTRAASQEAVAAPAVTVAAPAVTVASSAAAALEMSKRDRTMSPTTLGGRPVSQAQWQKHAQKRFDHELSFTASGEYDKILAMKDIYKGKRAFILGNGPSINQQDLTLLRDEITFVANWFINHKRFRRINPTFYTVSSHEMFGGWGKTPELNADFARLVAEKQTEQTFFFSYRFAEYMRGLGLVSENRLRTLIFDRPKFVIDEIGTQNYDLNRCMDDGYTVLLTFCVPLCVHFGITDIYLLGCDCDYGLTAPTDPKAYFYKPEQHTSATTSFDSLVRIWTPGGPIFQTYEIVAREAQLRGTRMWNATRGGKLELLPRVEYESLV